MTLDVAFHHGMADKLGYACRLLRKVWRSGAHAVVTGAPPDLDQLDRRLWELEDDFIPHVRAGRQPVPAHLADTSLWLVDEPQQAPASCQVLINLGQPGAEPPALPGQVSRVIELVSTDPADRQSGRQRWKHYLALGCTPQNIEVNG